MMIRNWIKLIPAIVKIFVHALKQAWSETMCVYEIEKMFSAHDRYMYKNYNHEGKDAKTR